MSLAYNNKINWSDSVWFFDVDDTLIDTEKASFEASAVIADTFRKKFGEDVLRYLGVQC